MRLGWRHAVAMWILGLLLAAVPAAAQPVAVSSADPSFGEQETVGLQVRVKGKGFNQGARAEFLLDDNSTGGITVISTAVLSSTELLATIDIAAGASLSFFDIRVVNLNGRTGRGSDLFQVVQKGASAGGKFGEIPVTTTIADLGSTTVPLRVASDGKGAYPGGDAKVDSIIHRHLEGSGWTLRTYYTAKRSFRGSSRTVWFDLTEPAAAGNPPAPIPAPGAMLQAQLIANCHFVGVDMLAMAAGTSEVCPGVFRFQVGDGSWYRLSFSPETYPHVHPIQVTCTAVDTAGCKVWTLAPSGPPSSLDDPNPKNVSRLLLIDENGGVLDDMRGDYYVSFSITVAR